MSSNSIPSTRDARILAMIQNSVSHKNPSWSENQNSLRTATLEALENNVIYEVEIQNEDHNILLENNFITLENVDYVYEQPDQENVLVIDSIFTGGADGKKLQV